MAVAAPVIQAEMDDWIALGGKSSGIVGDGAHGSGFHRAADEVPASDYSRRRDPNGADGPFTNWKYACAGDFWHGGKESLRAKHRETLARLMENDPALSMICEFIGQPWADRPVKYWARWEGYANLRNYTGSGHDGWSHISWYRSRADQRAYLWTPQGGGLTVFTGHGSSGQAVTLLQYRLKNLGYSPGAIDGKYGDGTAKALVAACKAAYNGYAGNGRTYGPAEVIYIDVLWARKYGHQPIPNVDLKPVTDAVSELSERVSAVEQRPAGSLPTTVKITDGTLILGS